MSKHRKLYIFTIISTILMIIALTSSAIIWDKLNIWIPFAIILPIFIVVFIVTLVIYVKYVKFVCPKCNQIFKPSTSAIIWSFHTPTKRKLKCPHCNIKSWCDEEFE